MIFAYVRPLLEYSDTVCDSCSLASNKLLDAIHIEAARIVSSGTTLCSVDTLFQELGWEPLQIRRDKHKLVTFYKIFMDWPQHMFLTLFLLILMKLMIIH